MNILSIYKKMPISSILLISAIILMSGTTLTADTSIPSLLLLVSFILLLIQKKIELRSTYNSKTIFIIITIVLVWVVQLAFYGNMENIFIILKNAIILLIVFTFLGQSTEKNILYFEAFVILLLIFSLISSLLFGLILIGVDLPLIETKIFKTVSVGYFLNFTSHPLFGFMGYRNSGIYWEPGMYQLYLNLILIYFLFKINIKKKYRYLIIIYSVFTIYTTGSVSGFFICAFIIIYYFLFSSSNKHLKLIFIPTAIILATFYIYPYLIAMLNTKIDTGESFYYRANDFELGILVFFSNPIWGYGLVNNSYADFSEGIFDSLRGNSNGLINILINFGLIGTYIYYKCVKSLSVLLSNNLSNKSLIILIPVWLVASLISEPWSTHPSLIFLLAIGARFLYDNNICKSRN